MKLDCAAVSLRSSLLADLFVVWVSFTFVLASFICNWLTTNWVKTIARLHFNDHLLTIPAAIWAIYLLVHKVKCSVCVPHSSYFRKTCMHSRRKHGHCLLAGKWSIKTTYHADVLHLNENPSITDEHCPLTKLDGLSVVFFFYLFAICPLKIDFDWDLDVVWWSSPYDGEWKPILNRKGK